jgi:hypothetical protein
VVDVVERRQELTSTPTQLALKFTRALVVAAVRAGAISTLRLEGGPPRRTAGSQATVTVITAHPAVFLLR